MKIVLKTESFQECVIFSENHKFVFDRIGEFAQNNRYYFVCDSSLTEFDEYKGLFPQERTLFFKASENNKTLKGLEQIISFFTEKGVDRQCTVIVVGGGITLDIGGFASSVFMRGINFKYVPTTLLAMVDASIGGKNGVNFKNFKNYVGNFNNPSEILITSEFLKTLPDKEFKTGLAEVVKYGLIKDRDLLFFIEKNAENIFKRERSVLDYIIEKSVKTKVDIVEQDFKEGGLRKILNFGHTLGHSLERLKKVSHGEGVSVGIVFASFVSAQKGYISHHDFEYVKNLLERLGLPVFVDNVEVSELVEGMAKDKKKFGDFIDFVLIKKFGNPFVEKLNVEQLESYLNDLFEYFDKKR